MSLDSLAVIQGVVYTAGIWAGYALITFPPEWEQVMEDLSRRLPWRKPRSY